MSRPRTTVPRDGSAPSVPGTRTAGVAKLVLVLIASLPGSVLHAAEASVEGNVVRVLATGDGRFGGCMAALDAPVSDAGLDCSGNWVTFSCVGEHAEKEDAARVFESVRAAVVTGKSVSMRVTDEKKHGRFCHASGIKIQDEPHVDEDSDADGVLDLDDDLPLDASETVDTDDDGVGNNADTDDDNDGFDDADDAFPLDPAESVDTDGDGTGDNADPDDDNDGVPDDVDPCPLRRECGPDLVVPSAAVSDPTPETGASFTVRVTVRNGGPAPAAATTLRYYRSANATISASDTEVGTDAVSGLASGAASAESIDLRAPSRAGTYYFGGCVDAVADEGDTANNCSAGVAVAVGGGSSYPGIVDEFPLGDENGGAVGITHAEGRLYVVDRGDRKVYAYRTDGARDAASDFGLDPDMRWPGGIAHGDGRLYVVDEWGAKVYAYRTDGSRDTSSDFDLVYEDGRPPGHRRPRGIAHTEGRLYVVDARDHKVHVYWTDGTRDASSDFDLDAGNRSPDGMTHAEGTFYVLDADKLYAYRTDGARSPSLDFDLDADNRFPTGIAHAEGTLYAIDAIADRAFVYSTDAPDAPDLVVRRARIDGANLSPGGSFRVASRVRNRGRAEGAETVLRYYRSSDADISAADTEVGTDRVPGLAAGSESWESITLTVRSNPGTHYYGACVDAVSGESDTVNNCSTGVAVGVSANPSPRALVDELSLDSDNASAVGITHAGSSLYVVDRYEERVYAYRTSGGRDASADFVLDDYAIPVGIAHAEGKMYVVDFDGKVYAYGTNGERDPLSDFDLHGGNGRPREVTHANGKLFVVDGDDLRVYVYRIGGGRAAASDFDLDPDNSFPRGIAHAEGLLYVVDSDEKVYAYRIDGARDARSDFDLDAVNSWPEGIAYANGRFYVVDDTRDKVYVYSSETPVDTRDLVVLSPSVSDASLDVGDSFTLDVVVRNRGRLEAAGTTLRFYRSSDATISITDTQVGTGFVAPLAAGAGRTESITLRAPSSAGTYYYGACVDSVSGESDDGNNCSDGVRVDVSGGGGGSDAYCRDGDRLDPGDRCDIYGREVFFEVVRNGDGCLLGGGILFCSGSRLRQDGTINGQEYRFYADSNADNSWTISDVEPEP